MKKLIIIVTILLAAIVGLLPATQAAEHVTSAFERMGIAIGIGVAGFIPVAIIGIRQFIMTKLGTNVAQSVLTKLEGSEEEVEKLAQMFMKSSTAKALIEDKKAHLNEQIELHQQWVVELTLAINDLMRKLPLFEGKERQSAESDINLMKNRLQGVKQWLNENNI